MSDPPGSVLDDRQWPARAASYRRRLDAFLDPRLQRARDGDPARHRHIPLRMAQPAIDEVVKAGVTAGGLRCTHYDAFRFFTTAFTTQFVPSGGGAPSRATQVDWEQPGCLHANMDLYKWCYKLVPAGRFRSATGLPGVGCRRPRGGYASQSI